MKIWSLDSLVLFQYALVYAFAAGRQHSVSFSEVICVYSAIRSFARRMLQLFPTLVFLPLELHVTCLLYLRYSELLD